MRFSVVVPIYNSESTVVRCVESIIASGLPVGDYEIILVNDGSTDGSESVCESLAIEHPFVKVISKENGGVSVARNVGVSAAKGEYVCFCDSDDCFVLGSFRNVILHCGEGIDLIRFYSDIVFQGDDRVSEHRKGRMIFQGTGKEYIRRFGIETFCWNYLYRKEFLVSKGLMFTPGIIASEDTDFIFRVMMADPMIISVNDHVYLYSIRSNSMSTDKSPGNSRRFATDLARTVIKIESILKEYKDSDPLLYYSGRKSLEARVVTLFSRFLSSDYSKEEFNSVLISLKAAGVLPFEIASSTRQEQISRMAISILSRFPGIFPLARWVFRHFFLPVIYPKLLRKVNYS